MKSGKVKAQASPLRHRATTRDVEADCDVSHRDTSPEVSHREWKPPEWHPHPGPQQAFQESGATEVLYGGAAGGGKSESLLCEAVRDAGVPGYHALLLRRTLPELEGRGSGMIPRSHEMFAKWPAVYDREQHLWRFPSGATPHILSIIFGLQNKAKVGAQQTGGQAR